MLRLHVVTQTPVPEIVIDWTLDPLWKRADALRRRVGLQMHRTDCTTLDAAVDAAVARPADMLMLMTSWRETAAATLAAVRRVREGFRGPIVYFDWFDQTSSPFLDIVPHVDLYLKKQLLRDREAYLTDSLTGFMPADFVARQRGMHFNGWRFGSVLPGREHLSKLMVGWNVGLGSHLVSPGNRLKRLYLKATRPFLPSIDVFYRVSLAPKDDLGTWQPIHRLEVHEALKALEGRHRVVNVAGAARAISHMQFRRELSSSKLAISPFSWGEVCDRDFEVVFSGVAMVKPDMSHCVTDPDIYVANETYFPIAWDSSDLAEVCERALSDDAGRRRVARQAYEVTAEWAFGDRVTERMIEVVEAAWKNHRTSSAPAPALTLAAAA